MRVSVSTALLAAATFVGSVNAHARVDSLWVNGVNQGTGAGKYIRQPPSNSPLKDLKSADLKCNVGGAGAVSGTVTVPAGATVEPEWFHDNRGDDIIDPSHVGPIVAYLAKASTNGEGQVWSKISEDGFAGSWAVTRMIANRGRHSVKIPADLAAGDYILRVEILALHESDTLFSRNSARGIQLYPSCSQITVTGSGAASLPATGVSFPGAYTDSEPGILFNVYGADPKTYVIPGPRIVSLVAGGAPATPATSTKAATSSTVAVTSSAAPVTSTVAVTSSAAPVTSSTVVATSSAAPVTSSTVIVTSSAAPVTSSTVVVTSSSAVVSSSVISTSPATVVTSSSPVSTSGPKDANVCFRDYNKCLDATQPNPDWTGCTASRDSCMVGAVYSRRLHSAKLGRRMVQL